MMCRLVHLFMTTGLIISTIYQPSTIAEPIRGHNMESTKIPFVVSIATKEKYTAGGIRGHFCTGSLITETLVLTAAHCIDDSEYETVDLVLRVIDLKFAKPRYEVHSWVTFREWALNTDLNVIADEPDDVAIIKLKRRVIGVTPANITTLKVDDLYEKNAFLTGWTGRDNNATRFLKRAKVQILAPKNCEKRYQSLTNKDATIYKGLICTAANPFTLLTGGDSGGPLLDENNNILAVNHGICPESGSGCNDSTDENRSNVHTVFMDKYKQFIDSVKANWMDKNETGSSSVWTFRTDEPFKFK